MKKNKEIYSQPTSKLLVVRFEKRILQGSISAAKSGGFSDPDADVEDLSNEDWGW